MGLILIAVSVGLVASATHAGVPGTRRLSAWWSRSRPHVVAFVRRSPATFVYLFILAVNTQTFASSSPRVAQLILKERSTNLQHLGHDPVRVLVLSAFWLGGRGFLPWAAAFVLVLAPAEYWLGTARCIVVFTVGHVAATLITALGIVTAIKWGYASAHVAREIDVGVSYGFMCVAALFTYRLRSPIRYVWTAGILGWIAAGMVTAGSYTDFGHLVAVVLGFVLYPVTRSTVVRARAREPLYAVARVT